MRCVVQHNYAASRDGRRFGPWSEGDEVEVDEADVEWCNVDSPGVLKPIKDDAKPAKKAAAKKGDA